MTCLPENRCAPLRLHLARLIVIGSGAGLLLDVKAAQGASTIEFQSSFMRQSPETDAEAGALALSTLSNGDDLGPGRYWVDIQVNLNHFGQREIQFILNPEGDRLLPCLSPRLLDEMGIRLDGLVDPDLLQTTCIDLLKLVPGAQIDFDGSKLSLALSVPQIAMRRNVLGEVDPERWDNGINAAFVSYQVSAQQTNSRHAGDQSSDDLYLNSGLNLGSWRLRSNQSLRMNEQGEREWTRTNTFAQRDLPGTHANLTLGETFTSGDVFRSVPIRGAVIGSDPGMLPDVLQNYAPIIRGVAQTRANLEIFQSGYPIYSTYVSPGPYEIDDLSISGGSGELDIVLTEADGQVRRFSQPYATLNNLLREGVWRYSSALGRYYGADDLEEPVFWQGTLAMGTVWSSTLYGGLMASDFYRAGTVGVSRDLGSFGALSLDLTQSRADIGNVDSQEVQGPSYAVKYGKSFASRTNVRFAGYRYSTEGYRDFDEAVRQRSQSSTWRGSRRSRLEASVYQNISAQSSLSLSLSQQDYWQSTHVQRQYQFNFNTRYKGVNYNLFASQSLSNDRGNDRQIGLSATFPLNFGHSSNATLDFQRNGDQLSQRASLSGSIDQNRLSYQASVSNDEARQKSAALSLGYQASAGSIGAGLTQGNDYRNVSLNASGTVMLHSGGVELGPYMGETTALVEVPGIEGIGVVNAIGVETNVRGYALVPYLRPYRVNHLVLETDKSGPEVEIDNGTAQVVPRRGAVVKATFAARSVTRLVITGSTANGQPLPFGAQVSNGNEVIGIVGQAGQVMLSTSAEPHVLQVRWGAQTEPRCQLFVDPQNMQQTQGYRLQSMTCQSSSR
ncbi:fimbria/pilus outer membrane usher protein [Pseudomonas sp. QTF5]|uniref:fimbria/pilus outer membrane usher protein n=1 Tax=Pseudomonas sp. QTF5 TaxID=1435425 RepID=UPI0004BE2790|nr:fimbria/pilus outer membrane usher protein [Pseudomonas sp. QTF5]